MKKYHCDDHDNYPFISVGVFRVCNDGSYMLSTRTKKVLKSCLYINQMKKRYLGTLDLAINPEIVHEKPPGNQDTTGYQIGN